MRNSIIRGMVDRLATRLEIFPNDEDGSLRQMRQRMTLGDKDAAKAALTKAFDAFASDAAVKGHLTAAARELGVESNESQTHGFQMRYHAIEVDDAIEIA